MNNQLLISIICLKEEYRKVIYDELNLWFSRATFVEDFMELADIPVDSIDGKSRGQIADIYHDGNRTVFILLDVDCQYVKIWKSLVDQKWSHLVENFYYEYSNYGYSIFETNKPGYLNMSYAFVPYRYGSIDGIYYDKQQLIDNLISELSLKGICTQAENIKSLKQEYAYLGIPLEIIPFYHVPIEYCL